VKGWIVTGTDTGVGKTHFCWLLLRALREAGRDAAGCKPVCCGGRDDVARLAEAGGSPGDLDEVNPVWFEAPVAPAVGAELEGRTVDLDGLRGHIEAVAARREVVVLEGIGGWEVPLTPEATFADFAATLGWPVVLVAANRLGVLNHALLTQGAIRGRGLMLAALVLNHLDEERDVAMVTNRAVLAERMKDVFLLELMPDQDRLEPRQRDFFAENSVRGGRVGA